MATDEGTAELSDDGEASVWEDNRKHTRRVIADQSKEVAIQSGGRRHVARDDRQGMGDINSIALHVGNESDHQRRQGGRLGEARTADSREGGTNSQLAPKLMASVA
jgi:hypothetical protein